jgi:hypothetical protein
VRAKVTLRRALEDSELLGSVLGGESWHAWRSLLLAANGESLTDDELLTFTKYTGRPKAPEKRVDELWCAVGRRGGKSRAMAVMAAYFAGLCDYSDKLARGERGVVLLIAQDKRAAKVSLDYAEGALESTSMLRQLIKERRREELVLTNGITLEVRAPTLRGVRGTTCVAVICDEIAFWRSEESANPDGEILHAVRPTLATSGGPLIAISSPYARRGELWNTYRKHYGPEGSDPMILVAQGASRDFNPELPQSVVDKALDRDPLANRAEYLAEFRTDVESLLTIEAVEAVVTLGARELAPELKHSYCAFVDPSGGSSDSMTLAIAHKEGDTEILDLIREVRPPFSPEAVVEEFAATMQRYRISSCRGDRYGGNWPAEQFLKAGISLEPAEKTKSDIYLDLVPLINSKAVRLLDNDRLTMQLVSLERSTKAGGRDRIDHPRGLHDDIANAAAGALTLAYSGSSYSAQQSFKDNLKLIAAYKKWARAVA